MYKLVERYMMCDIKKDVNAPLWVAVFNGKVIVSGSNYLKLKTGVLPALAKEFARA